MSEGTPDCPRGKGNKAHRPTIGVWAGAGADEGSGGAAAGWASLSADQWHGKAGQCHAPLRAYRYKWRTDGCTYGGTTLKPFRSS